ncbi:MAG: hypothetical protein ABSA34_02295 [Candidatus Goldiibacteriota bacterium]|jgi:hypothetical protein
MRRGALVVYLIIMLVALLGYLALDFNVRRADTGADDSMKMAVITMLQSECAVNMQVLEKDAGRDFSVLKISGLKNFVVFAGKKAKFGEQASKIWRGLKERIDAAGMLSGNDDEIKVSGDRAQNAANIDKDLKELMNRAAENGFDFNF